MKVDIFSVLVIIIIAVAALVGLCLVYKNLNYEHITGHMDRGANFYQAYCAVHEPRNIPACVDSILPE